MTQPAGQPNELKAIPALADWYATQHVEEQEGIAAEVAAGLAIAWFWSALPTDNLSNRRLITAWLHTTTLEIEKGWERSSQAAFEYVQKAKWSAEPDSPPLTKVDVPLPVEEIQRAMVLTGPIEVSRQIQRAVPEADALSAGESKSTGVGSTKATDGGRNQVLELVRKDAPSRLRANKVIGYARKTDSDPCYFCAVLASQGAVYFTEGTFDRSNTSIREVKWTSNNDKGARRAFIGDGPAKVHDNCQCTMRPVYSKSDSRDERAKFFLKQWNDANGMNDFRKKYVSPPPYSADVLDLSKRRQIAADAKRNRDALVARGFRADSPNVKFLDDSINQLAV